MAPKAILLLAPAQTTTTQNYAEFPLTLCAAECCLPVSRHPSPEMPLAEGKACPHHRDTLHSLSVMLDQFSYQYISIQFVTVFQTK